MPELHLRVLRFDPAVDAAPSYVEYRVAAREDQTVLDCMLKVRSEMDGSLAFRRSCRSGICGSCGVMANGRPVLACETKAVDVSVDGQITIEPLRHFRVLKDLVVDVEPFLESLRRIVPWLVLKPDHDGRMSPEAVRKVEGPATCILCGLCQATCQPEGIGCGGTASPAAAAKAYRLAMDPRDALGLARIALARDMGIVVCDDRSRLSEICPKGIAFETEILPALTGTSYE